MQDFIASNLGDQFIEPQTADLSLVYKDSSPTTPLIFVLSVGTDPAADLYAFAEVKLPEKQILSTLVSMFHDHFLILKVQVVPCMKFHSIMFSGNEVL